MLVKKGKHRDDRTRQQHVAGVVALMLSANPNLTNGEIREIIIETAGNSTPIPDANRRNITPVLSPDYGRDGGNIILATAINLEIKVTEFISENAPTSNPSAISSFVTPMNPGKLAELRYYYSAIAGLSSINDNIFNADDLDQNKVDFTKIRQVFNQLQRGIDIFRRLLPIIRR